MALSASSLPDSRNVPFVDQERLAPSRGRPRFSRLPTGPDRTPNRSSPSTHSPATDVRADSPNHAVTEPQGPSWIPTRRMEYPSSQRQWVSAVLEGHYRYYGVPRNIRALRAFYHEILWHWWRALRRRSQKNRLPWKRFCQKADHWLPRPRITHPYPNQRLCVTTRGRSPVR